MNQTPGAVAAVMGSHVARICLIAFLANWVKGNVDMSQPQRRVPKQIHAKAAVVETEEDNNPAETHLGGEAAAAAGHHGHGKYFMDTIMIQSGPKTLEFGHVCENPHEWEQRYERQDEDKKRYQGKVRYQHVPHKDHYEFGYRRGNEHHFKERYEKAHPHHGHFKTKARWGDKHGGYGEHYWDYNHGDHHGDDEGSDDEGGDGSHPVPDYQLKAEQDDRVKREPQRVDPRGWGRRPSDSSETEDAPEYRGPGRSSTTTTPAPVDHPGLQLAYDVESGTVVDEATGRRFLLTPIN